MWRDDIIEDREPVRFSDGPWGPWSEADMRAADLDIGPMEPDPWAGGELAARIRRAQDRLVNR